MVHRFKVRLGCGVGEGVGRSQSVIVVRDDLGVLEIFANQLESKAETAHKICGLAQKWQIGDWMGPPTLRYQGIEGGKRDRYDIDKMGSFGLWFGDATNGAGRSWWNGFSRFKSRRGANAVVRESGRLPSIRAGFAGYS
jgi:hypothetical protein